MEEETVTLDAGHAVRPAFLEAARLAAALLADPRVAAGWDGPSALAEFSLRGLAGHLVRGVTSVESYLDAPAPDGAAITAARYYALAVDTLDISSPLHVSVRERGEEQAAGGIDALRAELDAAIARLEARLRAEPSTRLLRVFGGLVLTLDEYLKTRIVELIVHADDVACSIGDEGLALPPAASRIAIETLVAVACDRHGDRAVLRALSRRERDLVEALRVL